MIFSKNLKNDNELNGYKGIIIVSTCQVLWMTIVDERIGISYFFLVSINPIFIYPASKKNSFHRNQHYIYDFWKKKQDM